MLLLYLIVSVFKLIAGGRRRGGGGVGTVAGNKSKPGLNRVKVLAV